MILEEETKKKFGYYSSALSPKSGKRIIVACDKCGKIRDVAKKDYSYQCMSCARIGNTACSGKKFSLESRERMSKAHKGIKYSKERNQKIAERQKGRKLSEECKRKISEAHKGKKASEETRRKMSESLKGKNSGAKHPNWQGGISFEPYCTKFNKGFKERIRDKFDRKCFICGAMENGRNHCVHHVNYSKSCLCDSDSSCQFVPLCIHCHIKTNHNREYWQNLIMTKLKQRLDGYFI